MVVKLRTFDGLAISIDTIAPKVSPSNFKEGKKITTKNLKVKISDNLSGITKNDCYLNGEWILAEHDGKTATLTIDTAGATATGKNILKVIVTDRIGNTTVKEWVLLF